MPFAIDGVRKQTQIILDVDKSNDLRQYVNC